MSPQPLPSQAGFIQFDVELGAWQENLATVRRCLNDLHPAPKSLLVLPELWATGFAYDKLTELAGIRHELLTALQQEASRHQSILAGSLIEHDRQTDLFFNTLSVVGPSGICGSYRKQQLFAPMDETHYFQAGNNPQAVITELGPMACLICFDLRFPDLAQRQVGQGANLIVVSAQWPEPRRHHWRTLLQARAIENQAFVVAANRCGTTADTSFAGASTVIDPNGRILLEAGDTPQSSLTTLDHTLLAEARGIFRTCGISPYRQHDEQKIVSLDTLKNKLAAMATVGKRVVFTNGCFDILHQGHVTYLEEARRQGDALIVGMNSDASIRAIKGPERPINQELSRARVLAALGCVDYVVIFGEETPLKLITEIKPNVLVKGADWPLEKIVGGAEVLAAGGQVINIPMVADFSTTGLIRAIKDKANRE
ncbi:MAG: D-glycero-beta-D-manno-heptose 1-phosphate adenylyltransferase [Desulfobulbaceae bacterium]|nr:D-glycero-beta-D-manno-heptose 1-phosphate adenylyltransferase [Desulfobulbaceae bacterium]